jgi:histidinol phosphatase-like enzyme
MTEQDLIGIHKKAGKVIRKHGGRIDRFYHCPALSQSLPNCRKPAIDMGIMAKKDFPDLNFSHSIMVGDSGSDIRFGQNLGMITVLISGNETTDVGADFVCDDLNQFYRIFVTKIN